jgi:hypothetical protein
MGWNEKWLAYVFSIFFSVPKWPDKCQSLPYDETTPVEKGLGMHSEPTANEECEAAWRLLYSLCYTLADWIPSHYIRHFKST